MLCFHNEGYSSSRQKVTKLFLKKKKTIEVQSPYSLVNDAYILASTFLKAV